MSAFNEYRVRVFIHGVRLPHHVASVWAVSRAAAAEAALSWAALEDPTAIWRAEVVR